MRIDTLAHVKNQFSTVVESLGPEPLFITRNGRVAAVLQAVKDDEVEDYLLRNSPRFWRLVELRKEQARRGSTIPFDPAGYQEDRPPSPRRTEVRERPPQYRAGRKSRRGA